MASTDTETNAVNKTEVKNENEKARLLVQQGYDRMATTYLDWTLDKSTPRTTYLSKLLSKLRDPARAAVLELGCGAGVPGTQILAARCAHVTANDISHAQMALAKTHVARANVDFAPGDMTKLAFGAGRFDGVVAFYSIIHLPRDEQGVLFQRIFEWLRPGGVLLCNLGASDMPGNTAENWLGGGQMYWSGYDVETNLKVLKEVGFEVEEHEILEDDEDGRMVPFVWFLAVKKS